MPIGSFVDGVFRGMSARDTMKNNERVRKMEDTQFERDGERHGWDKAKHELAMERARKAAAGGGGAKYSRAGVYREVMGNYTGAEGVAPVQAPAQANRGMSAFGQIGGGAPLSYGGNVGQAQPREMSALPAAQPQQIAQGPMEFDFVPGQGLMPRGAA